MRIKKKIVFTHKLLPNNENCRYFFFSLFLIQFNSMQSVSGFHLSNSFIFILLTLLRHYRCLAIKLSFSIEKIYNVFLCCCWCWWIIWQFVNEKRLKIKEAFFIKTNPLFDLLTVEINNWKWIERKFVLWNCLDEC